MIRSDQIDSWLRQAGLSEAEVRKLLDGGLAKMFDQIYDEVKQQAAAFINGFRDRHGDGEWTPERFQAIAKATWDDEYSKFMSRRVYDLFVRVAEQELLPGTKEGHFRTPNKMNILEGRSGDPFQDLCMALFSEAQERKK